jgi:hypothetical protein
MSGLHRNYTIERGGFRRIEVITGAGGVGAGRGRRRRGPSAREAAIHRLGECKFDLDPASRPDYESHSEPITGKGVCHDRGSDPPRALAQGPY